MIRKMIEIDEEKCNGCGLCVPNCHEGALQIVDGKAKLVSETYCDGLGNCLGHCPQDAIKIVEKDVAAFDFEATNKHLKEIGREELKENPLSEDTKQESGGDEMQHKNSTEASLPCGCPGTMVRDMRKDAAPKVQGISQEAESELRQWPIQLHLVPPNAGFLQDSDLLIAADCVSAADPNFHSRLLKDRSLLIGCPKLDDLDAYREKVEAVFQMNDLKSVTVAIMEVPCCMGLLSAVESALENVDKDIPLKKVILGIDGKIRQ